MLTLPIQFEDLLKVIDQLSDEQKQIILKRMNTVLQKEHPKPLKKRVAGLGEGTIWISSDFDDPLPDEFWLGEES
jgi:hypothetical protein